MKNIILRFRFYILAVIFILGFALRFYQLDKIPDGLYQDETAIGYNAYSILTTGKDEYGVSYPLYFKSFGDRKLPAYIYLTAASESVFGVNAFSVRFTSAILGSLTIIVLYFLVFEVAKKRELSLLSSFFLAITPWHMHFSRAGFEVNIALFFALAGTLSLIYARKPSRLQIGFLILSIISFGLSLYSYNVTRILSPLLALSVLFIYRRDYLRLPKYVIGIGVVVVVVIVLPFLMTIFSREGVSSAGGALITSNDIQARSVEFRSYFIEHALFAKLFLNKWVMTLWVYIENMGRALDLNFYFVKGSEHGNQGIGTVGPFYRFELPLFLFGVASLIQKKFKMSLFVTWGVVSLLVLSLSKEVPHATRGYFLVIPVTVIAAAGVFYILELSKLIPQKIRYIALSIFVIGSLYNFVYYMSSYFVRFPIAYAAAWRQQDQNLVSYIQANQDKYDKIIFDAKTDFIYTSYLFYSKYSAREFYSTVKRLPDDTEGFSKVQSFGKLEFKEVDWSKDYRQSRTLIVTTTDNKPKEVPPLKAFYFPTRPVVVSLKEELFEYPVSDIPYVLVEGRM